MDIEFVYTLAVAVVYSDYEYNDSDYEIFKTVFLSDIIFVSADFDS